MNCPNCGTPGLQLVVKRCRSCGEAFVTEDLLELNRLEFLLEETAAWEGTEALRTPYEDRFEALQGRLLRRELEEPAVAEGVSRLAPEPVVAKAVPAAAPEPVAPPAPREKVPFDQWLLSERNIKIALYTGGLLLVLAGLIFVGVNWARLSGPAKFAITLMITGLMYLGGYLLYQRPALRLGGIALLGVASGFVAVDFAVLQVYVLGPAGLSNEVMWLIASPLCLVLYLLTAYWTRSDLFTYISLAAVTSTVTAALVVVKAPELAYALAYALLAYGVLLLARAVQGTQVAEFTRLPTLIASQAAMPLVIVGAILGLVTGAEGNPWLAILTVGVGALFYATTDSVFKWLAARWVAAALFPVMIALALIELDVGDTAAGFTLMVLASAYLGVGYLLERREGRRAGGWPLYATAYALALFVTVKAIPETDAMAEVLFGDVVLLAVSAAIHRNYWWIYGAVWLFMLPMYLTISLFVPDLENQGLLMGLLGVSYVAAGYVLGRRSLRLGGAFLSAAAFLSVVAVALTWGSPIIVSLVLATVAVLYLLVALWLGWAWLLVPALLAVNLAVFAINDMLVVSLEMLARSLTISYATLGLVLALGGYRLQRTGYLNWAWPLYLVGGLDLGGAYLAGLVLGGPLAIALSAVLAVLLLSLSWLERAVLWEHKLPPGLTYLGIAVAFVGHFYVLAVAGVSIDGVWPAYTAGLCALFVGLGWLLRREPLAGLYGAPLRYVGLVLMTIPLAGSVLVSLFIGEAALTATTFTIACLAYGADGVLRRLRYLTYLGFASFVVVIWAALIGLKVSEPQAYVFPAGLALLGVGWNERRHGQEILYRLLTILGLVILMGSAFIQSLPRGDWPYALLLLVEGLASVGWGIRNHLRSFVQIGVLALIANAIAQLGPAFVELSGWIQLGLTGAILLGGGITALFKRERILAARRTLAEEWRQWEP